MCQECNRNGHITPGTELDHIVPVHIDPSDENMWGEDGVEILCKECHQLKTKKEMQDRIVKSEMK